MANEYDARIAEALCDYLKNEEELKFTFDEEDGVVSFSKRLLCSKLNALRFEIRVHDDSYVVMGYCPINVTDSDKEAMANVGEYLNRANYGLACGCFDLDYRDGEVMFRVWVPSVDGSFRGDECHQALWTTMSMFTRYGDGLLAVMMGFASPEKANDDAEKEDISERLRKFRSDMGLGSDEE